MRPLILGRKKVTTPVKVTWRWARPFPRTGGCPFSRGRSYRHQTQSARGAADTATRVDLCQKWHILAPWERRTTPKTVIETCKRRLAERVSRQYGAPTSAAWAFMPQPLLHVSGLGFATPEAP